MTAAARPEHLRKAGLAVRSFALVGTLVGVFTIAVGIGPRSTADVVYHVATLVGLACGFVVAARVRGAASGQRGRRRLRGG